MEIIKISSNHISTKAIKKVIKALKCNKVVVIPTDTVYGLSVNALNSYAIRKIFKIKKRSKKMPLSVIVRDYRMARRFVYFNQNSRAIFQKFLPGRLTLVLPCRGNLPKILISEKKSLGIRIPNNKIVQRIMKEIDFPITATSANVSNRPPFYSANDVFKEFQKQRYKPDLIIDGGELPKVLPSTVVDLTEGKIKIIRQGPIRKRQLVASLVHW